MKKIWLILLTFVSIILISNIFPATATETRCGWLKNPTPANFWLEDAEGTWVIGAQGGYQAQGMDNLPDFSQAEYVNTQSSYGYGCACLDVVTDSKNGRIISISGGEALPLNVCREAPNLPQ